MNRVYIFKAKLDGSTQNYIYKIGKSSGKSSIDRLLQVQRDHFMKYRYMFFASIKRDKPCENAFEIETKLHQQFKGMKYYFDKKHDGFGEWFMCEEHELLKAYDELLIVGK